jgi:formylglycine-generating enzyme required for sulfatase activity
MIQMESLLSIYSRLAPPKIDKVCIGQSFHCDEDHRSRAVARHRNSTGTELFYVEDSQASGRPSGYRQTVDERELENEDGQELIRSCHENDMILSRNGRVLAGVRVGMMLNALDALATASMNSRLSVRCFDWLGPGFQASRGIPVNAVASHFSVVALAVFTTASTAQPPPKDPPKQFTNSIGMKFVWIPPGSFMMGSSRKEDGRRDNETRHKVTLTKGFYLGAYAVTQEQWQAVMGNNPSYHRHGKNLPVENVSWDDCQEFLRKMAKKDGRAYRLPAEAEWEYACRAGTTTPYHYGEMISTDQANFDGTTLPSGNTRKGIFRNKTTPVGSFSANAWGLFDMHGNVWQWCADLYVGDYPEIAVVDPDVPSHAHISDLIAKLSSPRYAERQAATNALKEIGQHALPGLRKAATDATDLEIQRRAVQLVAALSQNRECRVLRGGSFFIQALNIRSAYRYYYEPTIRDLNIGFRAVADIAKETGAPN